MAFRQIRRPLIRLIRILFVIVAASEIERFIGQLRVRVDEVGIVTYGLSVIADSLFKVQGRCAFRGCQVESRGREADV